MNMADGINGLIILFINVLLMSYLHSCSNTIKTPEYDEKKTQDNESSDSIEVKNYINEITDIPLPSKSVVDLE